MKLTVRVYRIFKRIYKVLSERWFLFVCKNTAKSVGEGVKIFFPSLVTSETEIGANTAINSIRVIGSGACSIGRYNHIAYGCTIITSNHNYKGDGIPYDHTDIILPVKIGDFVWIGANVTILPGVTIGEGAIISAGSVVRKSIPALAIAGGNPATVFSSRDFCHYERMKEEHKFF